MLNPWLSRNEKINDLFYNASSYTDFKTKLANDNSTFLDKMSVTQNRNHKFLDMDDIDREDYDPTNRLSNGFNNNNDVVNNRKDYASSIKGLTNPVVDQEDQYYIPTKHLLIIVGISVIIVGGLYYIKDPSYCNELAYDTYSSVKDYIISYFWDRPDEHVAQPSRSINITR